MSHGSLSAVAAWWTPSFPSQQHPVHEAASPRAAIVQTQRHKRSTQLRTNILAHAATVHHHLRIPNEDGDILCEDKRTMSFGAMFTSCEAAVGTYDGEALRATPKRWARGSASA